MVKKKKVQATTKLGNSAKRSYLKQADVPSLSLDDAIRVPQAIFDHYAGKPTSPFQLAKALSVDPKGSQVRLLTGASLAFGLTEGGAQANSISVTTLGRQIVRPTTEVAALTAKREAVLKPRIFGDFLRQYDGNAFPRSDIAMNVLEEMGVPRDKASEVLERIDASARSVGFIDEINGKTYVNLEGIDEVGLTDSKLVTEPFEVHDASKAPRMPAAPPAVQPKGAELTAAINDDIRRRRVFITHGKNRALVDPIKKLLEYGELEAVISVDRQSVSKPVPEKVMDDMRGCGAAIIHVDADQTILDKDSKEHVILNPNVLIEIGAAMAFYGRRFILLVRDGVKLPSNLQGLYEVRYPGDNIDAGATIKLLEAIKDIKNHPLPGQDLES